MPFNLTAVGVDGGPLAAGAQALQPAPQVDGQSRDVGDDGGQAQPCAGEMIALLLSEFLGLGFYDASRVGFADLVVIDVDVELLGLVVPADLNAH